MKSKTRRQFVTDVTKFAGFTLLGGAVTASAAPPLRVRREIRDLATNYPSDFAKLCSAINTMMTTKFGGVTAWELNMQCHASVCGNPAKEIHGTLNFYPWHRGFLYATELNLQAAAKDNSITLPYWNWSTGASGGTFPIPDPYNHGVLFSPGRVTNLPIAYADTSALNTTYGFKGGLSEDESGFVGKPPGFGGYTLAHTLDSVLEGAVHNPIHSNAGPVMKMLGTSPRDPLFFGHHGNLDRLWEVWRALPGRAATEPWNDPTVPNFSAQTFSYYQYNSSTPLTIQNVNLRYTTQLGYTYADDPNAPGAMNLAKISVRPTPLTFSSADFDAPIASATATLRSTRALAPRATPKTATLSLVGITLAAGQGTTALIFLSDEAAGPFKLSNAVYAGVFGAVAVHHPSVVNYALDVTGPLERLHSKGPVRVVLIPYKSAHSNTKLVIKSFVISTF